jgi:hypothetical protein
MSIRRYYILLLLFAIGNCTSIWGKVVLAKNIVGGINILSQEMLNAKNTDYVILYDFVLGEDVAVPFGCSLVFDGGSISGAHTITGNSTFIKAEAVKIFSIDVSILGSWNMEKTFPEWFGAKGDGIFDDASAINKCLSFASGYEERPIIVLFTRSKYIVDKTINFSSKSYVSFEGTAKNIIKKKDGSFHNMFDGSHCKCIKISNLTLDGSLDDWDTTIPVIPNWSNKSFNACIIGAPDTTDFLLDNCVIRNFYYGVYLGGAAEHNRKIDGQKNTDHITIVNCIFERNKMSCIDTYNRFGLFISNNLFKDNGSIAVHIEPYLYENLIDIFNNSDVFTSRYPADGVNICNNTFVWTDTPSMGIKLYKGVSAVNVTNNHFVNGSCAISFDSTRILIISNNTIRNGKGIELYGNLGVGIICGNILTNVSKGISCSNNAQTMGGIDVHDNIIFYEENTTSAPDLFEVQNSKYHDNIIKGFFNYSLWKKKGVLDITGASNCEIYNNRLLKCNDTTIPFFIVPITNQKELSSFIEKGVIIRDNIYEQKLEFEFSTDVAYVRPNKPVVGQLFFDLNMNKQIVYTGEKWVDTFGNNVQ